MVQILEIKFSSKRQLFQEVAKLKTQHFIQNLKWIDELEEFVTKYGTKETFKIIDAAQKNNFKLDDAPLWLNLFNEYYDKHKKHGIAIIKIEEKRAAIGPYLM